MSGRAQGSSRLHLGTVVAVDDSLGPDKLRLYVECEGVSTGFRLGPLRPVQGPGTGGAAPWAPGDEVVVGELTPTEHGYVVLGRLAT